MNQLMVGHKISVTKKGDFLIDGKFTVEVGGKNKSHEQMNDLADSFVVADNIEIGWGNKIPFWLFGLK